MGRGRQCYVLFGRYGECILKGIVAGDKGTLIGRVVFVDIQRFGFLVECESTVAKNIFSVLGRDLNTVNVKAVKCRPRRIGTLELDVITVKRPACEEVIAVIGLFAVQVYKVALCSCDFRV